MTGRRGTVLVDQVSYVEPEFVVYAIYHGRGEERPVGELAFAVGDAAVAGWARIAMPAKGFADGALDLSPAVFTTGKRQSHEFDAYEVDIGCSNTRSCSAPNGLR